MSLSSPQSGNFTKIIDKSLPYFTIWKILLCAGRKCPNQVCAFVHLSSNAIDALYTKKLFFLHKAYFFHYCNDVKKFTYVHNEPSLPLDTWDSMSENYTLGQNQSRGTNFRSKIVSERISLHETFTHKLVKYSMYP